MEIFLPGKILSIDVTVNAADATMAAKAWRELENLLRAKKTE